MCGYVGGQWLCRSEALAWGEIDLVDLDLIIGIFIDVAKIIRRENYSEKWCHI